MSRRYPTCRRCNAAHLKDSHLTDMDFCAQCQEKVDKIHNALDREAESKLQCLQELLPITTAANFVNAVKLANEIIGLEHDY